MNTRIIFGIMFFGLVNSLFFSCEKSNVSNHTEAQPPYTDTGANVFSYYKGNRLFLCRDHSIQTNNHCRFDLPEGTVDTDTVFFMYGDYKTDTNYSSLQFRALHVNDTGRYEISIIDKSGNNQILYEVGHNSSDFIQYATTKDFSGELFVKKLDTINKIIAGTFSAKLKIVGHGSEFITITKGQFDFKYQLY